jgi:hypothetical protein
LDLTLHSLVFQEEATRFETYGITDLQGGAVDAFGKVICFAKTVLLRQIMKKCVKQPGTFNWKTDPMREQLCHGGLYMNQIETALMQ